MKRKLLLFSLLLALFVPWAAQAQETLTVYDGTNENTYVPIYGLYCDDGVQCEFVIPANQLEDMANGTISAMKFYLKSVGYSTISPSFTVFVKEVDFTTMTGYSGTTDATTVFNNTITFTAQSTDVEVDIPFSEDYTYGGGNLLIGIYQNGTTSYTSTTWYGVSQSYNSAWSGAGSPQGRQFLPKTTFTYTPGSGPTCDRPAEVTYEDLTSTSVTIKWNGGSGTYNMEYKKASDATWTSVLTNSSATSAELTGLTPATNYVAKVQSVCVFDDTTMYREKTVNFTTECDVITSFPWSEDFEDYATGNFTDPCWVNEHISGGGSYIFGVSTSNTHGTSTKQLYLPDMSSGTLTKLVLPEMNLPGNDYLFALQVNRNTNSSSYEGEGIRVYASTDGEIEGATELAFISRNYTVTDNGLIPAESASGWYEYELPIGFSGKCFIILRGESKWGSSTYLDDFSVKQLPSCQKPKNLALVSKTGHEAKVRWVPAVAGQTQWQFSLTPQGGTEQIIGPVTSADSTYTFTGLAGQTTYTVNVRAYCGEGEDEQSEWSANALTFTTDITCVAPTAFTVSDVTNHGATLKWTSEADAWQICLNNDENNLIDVTENSYTLSGLSPETSYTVKVRANCGSTEGLSSWTTARSFTTLVAYPAPSNVKCDSVLADKAYLSWFERGTAQDWEVIYKKVNDIEYDTLLTPDNHPCILGDEGMDPLTPDTVYVFKVRSRYPLEIQVDENTWIDTVSAWSNEVSFRTLQTCPAPTDFAVIDSTITANTATFEWNSIYSTTWDVKYRTPASIDAVFTEGFEDNGSNVPTGWTHIGNGSLAMTSTASRVHTGSYSLRFSGATSDNVVVLPKLGAEANTMEVSYWSLAESSTSSGTFQVGYVTDTTDVTTFQQIASYNAGEHLSYTQVNVSLASAPEGARVAFRHTSVSSSYWWWIDDVVIGTPIAAGTWQTKVAEEVPFELTGLEPLTDYEVFVVGNCANNEESDPSQTVFFTTLPSCLAPEGLALANVENNLTPHTATLSWTANGTETEWVIEYTAIVNEEAVIDTINVTENPYTLNSLLDLTPYAVRVKAYCSATDQSDWSNTVRFTTPVACPAPTNLAVDDITVDSATLTWTGTSDSYVVMIGVSDPENEEEITIETTYVDADFETGGLSQLGTITNDATYPWEVTTSKNHSEDGSYCMKSTNNGADNTTSSIEITVNLTGASTLSFYCWASGEWEYDYYDYEYYYYDYGIFAIDGVETDEFYYSSWQYKTYNLTAGTHTLTWSFTKDYSGADGDDCFYVDDIKIEGSVTVPVPSSWAEYPAEDATYTFSNLEAGTTYVVKVKSDCGEDEIGRMSDPIIFTTIASCPAPTDFAVTGVTGHTATMVWNGTNESYMVNYRIPSYLDGIEEEFGTTLPTGWELYTGLLSNGTATMASASYGWNFGTGNGVFDDHARVNIYGNYQRWLVMPEFEVPADINLNFDLALTAWSGSSVPAPATTGTDDKFIVLISNDDMATWTTLREWNNSGSEYVYNDIANTATGEHVSIDLSAYAGQNVRIAFYGESTETNADNNLHIDNVTAGVTVPATEWIPVAAADTTIVIDSLAAETTYEAKLQGICDSEESDWTAIITFTTTEACPAITRLDTISVDAHEAVLSWHEVGLATEWQICVNGDENNLIVATDTIHTLEGLKQDWDYTVKVRANCGEEDGTSDWSNLISFHTKVACAAPDSLAVDIDNIGTESATVMWTGESDSYIVRYNPWYQVGNDTVGTGEFITHTYDLSEYSGKGSIAIRHYNISDLFWLNVDDIELTNAAGDIIYTQNFENCNGDIPSEISTMDLDGDGHNWQIISTGMNVNGSYGIGSESYDNEVTYEALYPDNWLIISGVELGGQFSFAARGQQAEFAEENFGVFVSPEAGAGEEIVEGDNTIDLWDLIPNTTYAWQVAGVCGADTSNWVSSYFTTKDDVLVFVTAGNWNSVENWQPQELPTVGKNVRIEANAVIPAGVIAEANQITIDTTGSITIKDGGQLKQSSNALKVTMEKEIAGYNVAVAAAGDDEGLREDEVENNNYYLIATPFNSVTILGASTWNHVDSLIYDPYDLYTFDPANGVDKEWVNYKANPSHANFVYESNGQNCLVPNEGYLYANANNKTLVFKGTINKSNNNYKEKTIAYTELNKGWVLVGNPFTCNAYLTVINDEGETEANYYVMNSTGDEFVLAETTDGIAPLTAAFVNFDTTAVKVRINSEMPQPVADSNAKFHGATGKFVMNLSQDGNNVDKAVVRFGKGLNLEKMSLKNNSKLYIPAKDKEYAVVYSRNTANIPVSFKAETAGSYTINCAAEGVSFSELILVDNANDTKVDLLANPSYTFETEAGEFAGRFTIVYKVK